MGACTKGVISLTISQILGPRPRAPVSSQTPTPASTAATTAPNARKIVRVSTDGLGGEVVGEAVASGEGAAEADWLGAG